MFLHILPIKPTFEIWVFKLYLWYDIQTSYSFINMFIKNDCKKNTKVYCAKVFKILNLWNFQTETPVCIQNVKQFCQLYKLPNRASKRISTKTSHVKLFQKDRKHNDSSSIRLSSHHNAIHYTKTFESNFHRLVHEKIA